jgi:hypothetical protein
MPSPLDTTNDVLEPRALAVDRQVLEPPGTLGGAALASPAASDGADAEALLVAAIADRLLARLEVAGGDEASAELRRGLIDTLRRASAAGAAMVSNDAVGGTVTSGGLTQPLRAAIGTPSREPLRADEVERLAAAVPVILDDLAGGRFPVRAVSDLLLDPTSLPPPGSDERTDSDRAEDEAEAVLFEAGDSPPAAGIGVAPPSAVGPVLAAGVSPFSRLAKLLSGEMQGFLRTLRKMTRSFVTSAHTSPEGDAAHQLIQAHYLAEHLGDDVLVDDNVRVGLKAFTKLNASTAPQWTRVRNGLDVAGGIGQPDILNATRNEVYEIKPLNEMLVGAVQLWLRYLLPLNAASAIAAGLDKAAAVAFLGGIDHAGTPSSSPGWKPWLPGTEFAPAPAYVLPNGQVFMAARVAPGLIVYQYARTQQDEQEALATVPAPSAKKSQDYLEHYLVAALLAGAGLRARRQTSGGGDPLEAAAAFASAFDALPRGVDLGDSGLTAGQVALVIAVILTAVVLAKVVGGVVVAKGSVLVFEELLAPLVFI